MSGGGNQPTVAWLLFAAPLEKRIQIPDFFQTQAMVHAIGMKFGLESLLLQLRFCRLAKGFRNDRIKTTMADEYRQSPVGLG